MATDKRSVLITQANELVKQYQTYDDSGRLEYVYTANTDAGDGDECSVVRYVYDATYTNNVAKMKESIGTWDSSYDI